MAHSFRTVRWAPAWNPADPGGIEHLLLADDHADGVVIATDPDLGPFRLCYRLTWDPQWRLRSAGLSLAVDDGGPQRSLHIKTDGEGRWRDERGQPLKALDGCLDVDIWPTPFTNSFPIRRARLAIGERREFRMAWIDGTTLQLRAQSQAYTRLNERRYRFESLNDTGFESELSVDERGIVIDYPGLFKRV